MRLRSGHIVAWFSGMNVKLVKSFYNHRSRSNTWTVSHEYIERNFGTAIVCNGFLQCCSPLRSGAAFRYKWKYTSSSTPPLHRINLRIFTRWPLVWQDTDNKCSRYSWKEAAGGKWTLQKIRFHRYFINLAYIRAPWCISRTCSIGERMLSWNQRWFVHLILEQFLRVSMINIFNGSHKYYGKDGREGMISKHTTFTFAISTVLIDDRALQIMYIDRRTNVSRGARRTMLIHVSRAFAKFVRL